MDDATTTRTSIWFFDNGKTPLHVALQSGNVAVVRALLAAGANPKAVKDAGNMSVFFAARGGSVEVLRALEIPIDKGDEYLNWPLVEAVEGLLLVGTVEEAREAELRLLIRTLKLY